jgi:hypothetical protein
MSPVEARRKCSNSVLKPASSPLDFASVSRKLFEVCRESASSFLSFSLSADS